MADHTTFEGTHTLEDGKKLYTKTWRPSGEVRAYLAFVHGFSDHSNRYGPFFPKLASKGIEVRAFDQRGWGRSVSAPSEKGLTGDTTRVLADITSFLESNISSREVPSAPLFLMGHSMGGAEVLTYAAIGPSSVRSKIRGYLVEAPFVALSPATRPSIVTVVAGRLLAKVAPNVHMVNKVDATLISRDPEIQKSYVDDALCHDTGTLEGMAYMLDRASDLETGKTKIPPDAGEGGVTRLWYSHGTADGVCDFNATKKAFEMLDEGITDKELKLYDGWYHQLHVDLPVETRSEYANDVADWILARSGPVAEQKARL